MNDVAIVAVPPNTAHVNGDLHTVRNSMFLFVGFTCQPGGYLDIDSETQDCKPCPAGTYSLGGGALYDNWDHFPKGFSASVETFHMTRYFGQNLSNQSCARYGVGFCY